MVKPLIVAMVVGCLTWSAVRANGPAESIVDSEHVLGELMAIPAKQIPHRLLEEAQGIVIVPNVVKIGFVAGARRGHGIVMVRDPEGEWSLPQFLTLTGGSVGFQAGVQSTDVVLVFTTRKGIDGLMRGRFTIGVDAAATAGPVGREAAARELMMSRCSQEIFSLLARVADCSLELHWMVRLWKSTMNLTRSTMAVLRDRFPVEFPHQPLICVTL